MNAEQLRELDAWIAEHCMGWKRNQFISPHPEVGEFFFSFTARPERRVVCHQSASHTAVFSPTTDPAAAMMVLEKCAKKRDGYINILKTQSFYSICRQTMTGAIDMCMYADTLPLAICLFAKQLFEQQTKQKP